MGMLKEDKERKLFKCLRCEWQWMSSMDMPNVCPHCQSPYWDKERLNPTQEIKKG